MREFVFLCTDSGVGRLLCKQYRPENKRDLYIFVMIKWKSRPYLEFTNGYNAIVVQ